MNATTDTLRSSALTFHVERLRDVAEEAILLMREHARELGLFDEPWPLRPKFNELAQAIDDGAAVWVSAREADGLLCGYAVFTLSHSILFDGLTMASCDMLHLKQVSRRRLKRFMRFCEAELRGRGCAAAVVSPWGPMLSGTRIGEPALGWQLRQAGYHPKQVVYYRDIRRGVPA
jgi:hypothetical protein